MTRIRLENGRAASGVFLSDQLIDAHLAPADPQAVKLYLFLLRAAQRGDEQSADSLFALCGLDHDQALQHLRFFEARGLLRLTAAGGELCGITFSDGQVSAAAPSSEHVRGAAPVLPTVPSLTRDQSRSVLRSNEEAREIIHVAENYLGRTLSSSDIDKLLYLYEELAFPADLLDYLVDYCVSCGSRSMHYIEKVALEWYNDGIRQVEDAKARTASWSRDYYAILRAFGISGRNPVPHEIAFMDRWLSTYRFPLEIIEEACARTISAKGKASFDYTEGILSKWAEQNVRTPEDVQRLDALHSEQAQQRAQMRGTPSAQSPHTKKNRFHNFHERDYQDDQLERELLARQRRDRKDKKD